MKIGIDIDDTIAKTNDRLIVEAVKYDRECCKGKGFKDKDAYSFMDMFFWNVLELDGFFNIVRKGSFFSELDPVEDAVDYVNQLRKDGHKTYLITRRENNFKTKSRTKKWLKNCGFTYDKLIMGCAKKGEECEKLGIDLLIDNDIKNIESAEHHKVKGILKGTPFNETTKYNRIEDWKEIYKYISKGR
ncbi:MAG TPA: hypothetical protein DCE23_06235 [Firmicutes bacterium]|nr:hypothetical protein [Bacillota bacterium]